VSRLAPRVGVIGKSGVGKTTLLKTIVLDWLREVPNVRFLAWDHTLEWETGLHPNLHVFRSEEFELSEVCEAALDFAPCTVVADELDAAANVFERLKKGMPLHTVTNYGRHRNVGLLWAVRRCMEIPRGITANTNHLFILQTDEPTDLDWLKKKAGQAVADRASELQPGDWFYKRC
jgi:ABC-type phosphonate transport system ATPase subunit